MYRNFRSVKRELARFKRYPKVIAALSPDRRDASAAVGAQR